MGGREKQRWDCIHSLEHAAAPTHMIAVGELGCSSHTVTWRVGVVEEKYLPENPAPIEVKPGDGAEMLQTHDGHC